MENVFYFLNSNLTCTYLVLVSPTPTNGFKSTNSSKATNATSVRTSDNFYVGLFILKGDVFVFCMELRLFNILLNYIS